jgi:hypothetical protein
MCACRRAASPDVIRYVVEGSVEIGCHVHAAPDAAEPRTRTLGVLYRGQLDRTFGQMDRLVNQ